MKLAAQLYTLREFTKTAEGFRECLARCADIGYAGVQLSAVGCMNGPDATVTAEQARAWLDDYELVCCATHRPWNRLAEHTSEEIEFHQILGCDYTAVGGIGAEFGMDGRAYRSFLEEAEPLCSALHSEGIQFGYHNHSHEFIKDEVTGLPCIDLLINEGAPFLQMEIDTYWVAHAGADPAEIIHRCRHRANAIHVKDMEVVPTEGPVMAPVGEGNLNWHRILDACRHAGTHWLIVEQDTYRRDPFDCLNSSYTYLAAHI